ncbi:MAG: hypothetical protein K2P81_10320 [Bacteriovoracaceae bacterium]|nr:hypothetical protein [Bacteriovoracaceae bacterium]
MSYVENCMLKNTKKIIKELNCEMAYLPDGVESFLDEVLILLSRYSVSRDEIFRLTDHLERDFVDRWKVLPLIFKKYLIELKTDASSLGFSAVADKYEKNYRRKRPYSVNLPQGLAALAELKQKLDQLNYDLDTDDQYAMERDSSLLMLSTIKYKIENILATIYPDPISFSNKKYREQIVDLVSSKRFSAQSVASRVGIRVDTLQRWIQENGSP